MRVVRIPWTNAASYKPNLESCSQYKPFGHKSQTLVHVGHSLDICLELSFMKMEVMENTAMLRYVFTINTSAKTVHAYKQNINIMNDKLGSFEFKVWRFSKAGFLHPFISNLIFECGERCSKSNLITGNLILFVKKT